MTTALPVGACRSSKMEHIEGNATVRRMHSVTELNMKNAFLVVAWFFFIPLVLGPWTFFVQGITSVLFPPAEPNHVIPPPHYVIVGRAITFLLLCLACIGIAGYRCAMRFIPASVALVRSMFVQAFAYGTSAAKRWSSGSSDTVADNCYHNEHEKSRLVIAVFIIALMEVCRDFAAVAAVIDFFIWTGHPGTAAADCQMVISIAIAVAAQVCLDMCYANVPPDICEVMYSLGM